MLETKVAYLAGLIDGEGSINLWIKEGRLDFYFRVLVYNTYEEVIDWCCLHFGGSKYKVGRRKKPEHKQEYQWFVSSGFAYDILKQVLPYLIIKKAKAEIAIEAWENRQPTPLIDRRKINCVSDDIIELRKKYAEEFKKA